MENIGEDTLLLSRNREKNRDRLIDRKRDKQRDRERESQKEMLILTNRHIHKHTKRQQKEKTIVTKKVWKDRQNDKRTERLESDRQKDRESEKW